jgi:hypothetical protein
MTLSAEKTISQWLRSSKVPVVGIGLIEEGNVK